jgi:PKHD-type hydroxylase
MFLVIGGVLDAHEVAAVRDLVPRIAFIDGRATAGRYAREVKRNEQAAASPELEGILAKVEKALLANDLFVSAARPRRIVRLLLSRYSGGQEYGSHVDDAIMAGARTDLSFTLFLTDEAAYEGGALVVEDPLEERAIRLGPGDLVLYPSTTLHRVEPVTRGERLAVVGWATSWVRDAGRREILFDLDRSLRELHASQGKSPLFDRIAKTRSNLLRLWAEG